MLQIVKVFLWERKNYSMFIDEMQVRFFVCSIYSLPIQTGVYFRITQGSSVLHADTQFFFFHTVFFLRNVAFRGVFLKKS